MPLLFDQGLLVSVLLLGGRHRSRHRHFSRAEPVESTGGGEGIISELKTQLGGGLKHFWNF